MKLVVLVPEPMFSEAMRTIEAHGYTFEQRAQPEGVVEVTIDVSGHLYDLYALARDLEENYEV